MPSAGEAFGDASTSKRLPDFLQSLFHSHLILFRANLAAEHQKLLFAASLRTPRMPGSGRAAFARRPPNQNRTRAAPRGRKSSQSAPLEPFELVLGRTSSQRARKRAQRADAGLPGTRSYFLSPSAASSASPSRATPSECASRLRGTLGENSTRASQNHLPERQQLA